MAIKIGKRKFQNKDDAVYYTVGLKKMTVEQAQTYVDELERGLYNGILSGVTDTTGVVRVQVPASFVTQEGTYVVFVKREGAAPTLVATYQASTSGAGSN